MGFAKRPKVTRSAFELALVLLGSALVVTFLLQKRASIPDLLEHPAEAVGSVSNSAIAAVDESAINGRESSGISGDGGRSKRLMLVTGTDGRRCDTERGLEVLTRSLKNKVDYARLHNIPMYHAMEVLDDAYDLYWIKIALLKTLMITDPAVEWFMWVDCDAIFTDMSQEVPLDKYENYNFVLTGKPEEVFDEPTWLGFNTGGFLLRNCQWSLDLLDAAMDIGKKFTKRSSSIPMLNKAIKGRGDGNPDWPADDQTTLIYLMHTQPELWKEKTFIEQDILYHAWWVQTIERLDKMVLGNGVAGRESVWPFISHFTGCKFCNTQYADKGMTDKCLESFDQLYRFADNQILGKMRLQHKSMDSAEIEEVLEVP